jgi:hypothetical protein
MPPASHQVSATSLKLMMQQIHPHVRELWRMKTAKPPYFIVTSCRFIFRSQKYFCFYLHFQLPWCRHNNATSKSFKLKLKLKLKFKRNQVSVWAELGDNTINPVASFVLSILFTSSYFYDSRCPFGQMNNRKQMLGRLRLNFRKICLRVDLKRASGTFGCYK